ncbi:hypothetical protein JXB31_02080 [Candidatus Woesearchaeota archaeon]|nr:hypothetical protein [Candidatus Woesearchaeota archaeon]
MDFIDFMLRLDDYRLEDSLFPFIMIFTIVFAILSRVNIFGKEKKGINFVLALVMALTTVIMHVTERYPADKDPVNIINSSVPIAIGVVVALLGVLLLISVFGGEMNLKGLEIGPLVIGLAVLFFINFAFPDVPFWIGLGTSFLLAWRGSIPGTHHKSASYLVTFVIIGITYIFGSNAGFFEELPYWMSDSWIQMVVVAVLVFIGVAMFISGSGDD